MFRFFRRLLQKPFDRDAWMRDWRGPIHVWSHATIGLDSKRVSGRHFNVDVPNGGILHDSRTYFVPAWTAVHLINGDDHVLVSDELRQLLGRCSPGCVQLVRATVVDGYSGKLVNGYSEVVVRDRITPQTLGEVHAAGDHAWQFTERDLFVTPSVMRAIQSAGIEGLVFAPGFRDFLGISGAVWPGDAATGRRRSGMTKARGGGQPVVHESGVRQESPA